MKKRIVGTLFAVVLVTSAFGRDRALPASRGGQTLTYSPQQVGKGKWAGYGTTLNRNAKQAATPTRGSQGKVQSQLARNAAPQN